MIFNPNPDSNPLFGSHSFQTHSSDSLTYYTPAHIINAPTYVETITIDDDDDGPSLVMYEPLKKQKTELSYILKPNKSGSKIQKKIQSNKRPTTSLIETSRKSDPRGKIIEAQPSQEVENVEIPDISSLISNASARVAVPDQLVQSFNKLVKSLWLYHYYDNLSSILSSEADNSPVSSDDYSVLECCELKKEDSTQSLKSDDQYFQQKVEEPHPSSIYLSCPSTNHCEPKKEEWTQSLVSDDQGFLQKSEEPYSSPTFSLFIPANYYDDFKQEDVSCLNKSTSPQRHNTVAIPSLDIYTSRGKRITRTIRPTWKPDGIRSDVFDKFMAKLSRILGYNVTNEEKAAKLLEIFGMDIDETLKELRGNKAFYRNHFKSDHRLLRSRIPLF